MRISDVHDELRDWWNRDAHTYDDSPSHAASDPVEAAAWRSALRRALPAPPARVLDAGAGTGSMSLLAAELGYRVTALDLSEGMLSQAERKAAGRGIDLDLVHGPAHEPPEGPFDAVMERHLIWTAPDPVEILRAWRRVTADGGRLVMFEGSWGSSGPVDRLREASTHIFRRVYGIEHDHHDEYRPELRERLPLSNMAGPGPLIESIVRAGWKAVRLARLRDVEWARREIAPPVLRWLEAEPMWVLVADA
ncbi:MAG: methyltransferase domain-containing protein [Actinomycetota bacterium]